MTLAGPDGGMTDAPRGTAWLELNNDGTVSGSYGCDAFRGSATVRGATVTFGAFDITDRRCDRRAEEFDRYLKSVLTGTLTAKPVVWSDSKEVRFLVKKGGAEGIQVEAGRPVPLIGTKWRVSYASRGDSNGPDLAAGDEVYFTLDRDGTVRGKAGCNMFSGDYTVDGDVLTFSEVAATTHATCSEQVMSDEAMVLESFAGRQRLSLGHASLSTVTIPYTPMSKGLGARAFEPPRG